MAACNWQPYGLQAAACTSSAAWPCCWRRELRLVGNHMHALWQALHAAPPPQVTSHCIFGPDYCRLLPMVGAGGGGRFALVLRRPSPSLLSLEGGSSFWCGNLLRLWDLCQQTLQSGGGIQLVLVESACMCVVLEGPPHTAVRDSSPAFKIVALYLLFQGSSCAAQYACTLHLLVNGVCVIFDSLLCCRPSASKAACVQLWNLRLSTLEVSNTLFLGSVGCCTVRANTSCLAERLYMARLWAGCALGDRVSSVHDCKASACSSCCASRGLRRSTDLHLLVQWIGHSSAGTRAMQWQGCCAPAHLFRVWDSHHSG